MNLASKRKSLIAVLITFAISSLSATIVFPILTPLFLSQDQSIIRAQVPEGLRSILLGFFLASFPLAQFFFAPIVGEYADHKGRKKAYLWTILLEAVGYFISALGIVWRHLGLLFLGRFITGIAAGNMSVCLATLVDLSPDEKTKARYFSYGSAVAGIMFVLGPFLGGKLSDLSLSSWFTLAFPMWIGGALALFNLLVIGLLYKETILEKSQDLFDVMKAWHNVQYAFREGRIRRLFCIYFFFLFAWNMLYQFMPAVMVEEFSSTSANIGDVSALMGCVWIAGTLLVHFFSSRFPSVRSILLASLICFAIATVFIPVPHNFFYFLLITGLGIFFAGGMWPIFNATISNAAGIAMQGKILGLASSIQSLSMMLAPLLGGFFLQAHNQIPFIIAAVSAFIAVFLIIRTNNACFKNPKHKH